MLMWWSVRTKKGASILAKARWYQEAIDEAMDRMNCNYEDIDLQSVVAVERFHREHEYNTTLGGKPDYSVYDRRR